MQRSPAILALLILALSGGCVVRPAAAVAVLGKPSFASLNSTAALSAGALTAKGLQPESTSSSSTEEDPSYAKENYKKETTLFMSVSVECVFAFIFCGLVGSVPVVLALLVGPKGGLTLAHKIESLVLMVWLLGVIVLFTTMLTFNSGAGHWEGARPLTIVEAVYLLSQILTTVGYGDITPAQPVAQVMVAFNVILALCLYGSLIMETVDLAGERIKQLYFEKKHEKEEGQTDSARASVIANTQLKEWTDKRTLTVDLSGLRQYSVAFGVCVLIGVLFWHYYPGEERTWLQAIYMSVITLSTVGFGAFTATTPGGMVFGAFWMLFGVAALGALISSFVDVMFQTKAMERENPDLDKLKFYKYVSACSHRLQGCEGADREAMAMDRYEFLKFGLLLQNKASEEDIRCIEERFAYLSPDKEGHLSLEQLLQGGEAPPGYARRHLKSASNRELR